MKRKYSLIFLTTPNCSPPEMIYLAERTGYDFVSLRTIAMGLPGEIDYGLTHNRQLLKATQAALEDTGVCLLDIENARIHTQADFTKYFAEMEIAAELGAQAVLTNVWTHDRKQTIEQFSKLCEKGEELGLKVNLEFVTWSSIRNISEAVSLVEECGYDNCGIIIDTLHFYRSRCSINEISLIPAKYLSALHLCDAPAEIPDNVDTLIHTGRAERLYVGEGEINIAAIVKAMPEVVIGLEIPHLKRLESLGPEKHALRCLKTAKDYLHAETTIL